jgi:hypothetical protein
VLCANQLRRASASCCGKAPAIALKIALPCSDVLKTWANFWLQHDYQTSPGYVFSEAIGASLAVIKVMLWQHIVFGFVTAVIHDIGSLHSHFALAWLHVARYRNSHNSFALTTRMVLSSLAGY